MIFARRNILTMWRISQWYRIWSYGANFLLTILGTVFMLIFNWKFRIMIMIGRLMMKHFLRGLRTRNIEWYLKLNKMYVIVFSVLRCFFFFVDGRKLCLLLIFLYYLLEFMCIGMILSNEFICFLWEIKVFFLLEKRVFLWKMICFLWKKIRVFFLGWLNKVIDCFWFVFLGIFILFIQELIFSVILIIILKLRIIFIMHLYFKMALFRLGLRLEKICLFMFFIQILLVFLIILIGLIEGTF